MTPVSAANVITYPTLFGMASTELDCYFAYGITHNTYLRNG